MRGWYTHGMVGVDFGRAFAELDVPQGFRVECAIALGRIGDPAGLPEPLRAREPPSGRQPLSTTARMAPPGRDPAPVCAGEGLA